MNATSLDDQIERLKRACPDACVDGVQCPPPSPPMEDLTATMDMDGPGLGGDAGRTNASGW